jgi:murein DD-endopeptidase MepM/ murein hydrolase activator NlpD
MRSIGTRLRLLAKMDLWKVAIFLVVIGLPGLIHCQINWNVSAHSWGGSGTDYADSLAKDSAGNVYVAGGTNSFGSGGTDVLLLKYDATGHFLWAKTWGGGNDEYATSVAVGPDGFVYVTGGTFSFGAGWFDIFLLKLDIDGNLIWATTWGGGSYDVGHDIGFDSAGNIYVVGEEYSFGPCCSSAVLLKFTPSGGTPIWTAAWKGPATYDTGYSLTVDSNGNVIVAGISWDYSASPLHNSILLVKYDAAGNYVWSKNWATPMPGQDESWSFRGVTTDAAGNIYVGNRHANNCPTIDFGRCDFDALVLKLGPDGSFQWARTWGGTGYDTAASLAIDPIGHLVVSEINDFLGTPELSLISFDTGGNTLSNTTWSVNVAAGISLAGMILDKTGTAVVAAAGFNNSGSWLSTPLPNATSLPDSFIINSFSISSPVGITSQITNIPSVLQTGLQDMGGGGTDILVTQIKFGADPKVPPILSISSNKLAFGNVPVGKSLELTVKVMNAGGSLLTGTAAATSPFTIVSPVSISVLPGESQTLTIDFVPSAAGQYLETILITTNAGIANVALQGTGVQTQSFVTGQITLASSTPAPLPNVPVVRLDKDLNFKELAFTDVNGAYFLTNVATKDYIVPVSSGTSASADDTNLGVHDYAFSLPTSPNISAFCQIGVPTASRKCEGTKGSPLGNFVAFPKPAPQSPSITLAMPLPSGSWRISVEAGGFAVTDHDHPIDADPSHTDASSGFYALDFPGPCGTPILAVADGYVRVAGAGGSFGRTVVIEHSGGLFSRYAHLDNIPLKDIHTGVHVTQGEVIGYMGNGGVHVGGAHLHFQIYDGDFQPSDSQSADTLLRAIRLKTGTGNLAFTDFIAGKSYQSTNGAIDATSCSH